jgi:hypothetical protein
MIVGAIRITYSISPTDTPVFGSACHRRIDTAAPAGASVQYNVSPWPMVYVSALLKFRGMSFDGGKMNSICAGTVDGYPVVVA